MKKVDLRDIADETWISPSGHIAHRLTPRPQNPP